MDVAHRQPLLDEVVEKARRPAIGEHPVDLLLEDGRILQPAARGEVDQLVVGHAPPQEERQPRRQLEIAQLVDRARLRVGRIALDAQEELR